MSVKDIFTSEIRPGFATHPSCTSISSLFQRSLVPGVSHEKKVRTSASEPSTQQTVWLTTHPAQNPPTCGVCLGVHGGVCRATGFTELNLRLAIASIAGVAEARKLSDGDRIRACGNHTPGYNKLYSPSDQRKVRRHGIWDLLIGNRSGRARQPVRS